MIYFYEKNKEQFIEKYKILDAILYGMCYAIKCDNIEQ